MSNDNRPVVFIASSTEGLEIAKAIQVNIDHDAESVIWSQGVFGLSDGTLESLISSFKRFDFAIFVLTPDDLAISRGVESELPRDNVVFELGLFMGALGRERCFIVHDRTKKLKLPSDLAGITPGTFQPPTQGTLVSALGALSTQVTGTIRSLGSIERSNDEVYIDQKTQFGIIADLLEPAVHQFLIIMHGSNAALAREGLYMFGPRYEYAIHTEKHNGSGNGSLDVNKLCTRLADAGLLSADLRGQISLTERGHAFAEWLAESGYKAHYFWSDIGNWGERPADLRGSEHPNTRPRNVLELQARSSKSSRSRSSSKAKKVATKPKRQPIRKK